MSSSNAAMRFIEGRHRSIQEDGEAAGAAALFVGVSGLDAFWLYTSHFPAKIHEVALTASKGQSARPIVKQVMRLLAAKHADKKFDEETGQVSYLMKNDYYKVKLVSGPPTSCEVEQYETEETIPAREEETRTVTRFRLVDPKCIEGGQAPPPKTEEERLTESVAEMEKAQAELDDSAERVAAAVRADAESASPEELEAAAATIDRLTEEKLAEPPAEIASASDTGEEKS